MNNSTSSKTGLFLMELIIAILFFSVSGAICVQLFVQSHITSKDSVELNHAVEWCQNVAEAFYGCEGNPEEMMALFENSYVGDMAEAGNTFYLNFNEDFQPTPVVWEKSSYTPSDHAYKVSVHVYEEDKFIKCNITAYAYTYGTDTVTEPIYKLTVQLPAGKETAHE
ncbi:MAG: hypothetical protein IJ409_03575 [Lachnospiraceae bacterium]|nr:hypothetical protein [Lachnospiraceae bacterium]